VTFAIQELEARGKQGEHAVREFLRDRAFPIVEGTTVTFVHHGPASEVRLRHWIWGLASAQPFTRLPGTDLWFFRLELPEGSRMEYKLEIVRNGVPDLVLDPLNPNQAHDPYGANSVVYGTGYVVPDWTQPDPEARLGRLESHVLFSDVFQEPRPIKVYVPARFREERRYPLLILHDGSDFLRFTGFETVLDNLIHRLEIAPMIVAFIDSPRRLQEYADDERHARFLVDELVPLLEGRFPILPSASARGLAGASFGAVASLAAAWRRPGSFGNLFLLSGSFAFTDIGGHDRGPLFDPVVAFMNAFRKDPGRPAERVFVSCGIYESLIYYNRSLAPVLQATGMDVRYLEAKDSHNWENWRDRMRGGLSWLYPGPLWMVYE